jgi:hypothetical protein
MTTDEALVELQHWREAAQSIGATDGHGMVLDFERLTTDRDHYRTRAILAEERVVYYVGLARQAEAGRDALIVERRRDALDGQAALDEANNEVVRVRAERDAPAKRWERLRGNVDACKQDHTYGDGSGFALTVLDWMRELEAQP